MKHLIIALALLSTLLAATDSEIDRLIEAVLNASPETRYEKMNAFKTKMRELNAQQRSEALKVLQAKVYPQLDPATAAQRQPVPTVRPDQTPTAQQQMRSQQQQYRMQESAGPAGKPQNKPVTPPTKRPF